jgi:hypothetical protein
MLSVTAWMPSLLFFQELHINGVQRLLYEIEYWKLSNAYFLDQAIISR